MSTTPEVTITATAHTDCHACEMSVEGVRSYIANGGRIANGKAGNSQVDGGPHWATFTTKPTQALAEEDDAPPEHDAAPSPWEASLAHLRAISELLEQLSRIDVDRGVVHQEVASLPVPFLEDLGEALARLDTQRPLSREAEADRFGPERLTGRVEFSCLVEVHGDNADPSRGLGELLKRDEVGHRGDGRGLCVSLNADVSDGEDRAHSASPSAGDGAEPGLASTLSVEGEPAAGGSSPDSPAATSAHPQRLADEVSALRGEVRAVHQMTKSVIDTIVRLMDAPRPRPSRRPALIDDQEPKS